MHRPILTLALLAVTAGCEESPDTIALPYDSQVPYEKWSCSDIGDEARRFLGAFTNNGQAQVNIPIRVAVGELDALRKASINKECGHNIPDIIVLLTPEKTRNQTRNSE